MPQFAEKVPEHWPKYKKKILCPTEWVGYESGVDYVFAQVAYPVPPNNEQELPEQYKIYLHQDDFEGKIVSSSKLVKLYTMKLEAHSSSTLRASGSRIAASQTTSFDPNPKACQPNSNQEACQPNPKEEEGLRYIEQARVDFDLSEVVKEIKQKGNYGLVCFLSQQIAEKALQGAVLYYFGKFKQDKNKKKSPWHTLEERASMLTYKIKLPKEDIDYLKTLEEYYLKTRYPNRWPNDGGIPAEHYDRQQAETALKYAKDILDTVREKLSASELLVDTSYSYID